MRQATDDVVAYNLTFRADALGGGADRPCYSEGGEYTIAEHEAMKGRSSGIHADNISM